MIKRTLLTGILTLCESDVVKGRAIMTLDDVAFNGPKFPEVLGNVAAELVVYVPQTIKTPDDAEWIVSYSGSHYLMSRDMAVAVVGAGGSWKILVSINDLWTTSPNLGTGKKAVVKKLAELKLSGYSYEPDVGGSIPPWRTK